MIGTDGLRDRFCAIDSGRNITWDLKEFQLYLAQVNRFLESLLLLVHLNVIHLEAGHTRKRDSPARYFRDKSNF